MADQHIEKEFAKERKFFREVTLKVIELQEVFDTWRIKADCRNCDIGKEELKIPFYEMYRRCDSKKECKKVISLYKKMVKLRRTEDKMREEYAEKIFNYFSPNEPMLIINRTKQPISWRQAFGTDFALLSEEVKGSLIALIEEDGGRYRLDI